MGEDGEGATSGQRGLGDGVPELGEVVPESELGCDVAACITILDREEGGQDAFRSAGISLRPLILRSDVTGE